MDDTEKAAIRETRAMLRPIIERLEADSRFPKTSRHFFAVGENELSLKYVLIFLRDHEDHWDRLNPAEKAFLDDQRERIIASGWWNGGKTKRVP